MTEKVRDDRDRATAEKRPRAEEMNDSWLLDLVDDPETDRALSEAMVAEAVEERGMSREEAEELFMPVEKERPIELEDLCRMMSDILAGKPKPHIETKAGCKAWRALERDIEDIKRRGGVVEFPAL